MLSAWIGGDMYQFKSHWFDSIRVRTHEVRIPQSPKTLYSFGHPVWLGRVQNVCGYRCKCKFKAWIGRENQPQLPVCKLQLRHGVLGHMIVLCEEPVELRIRAL